MDPNSWLLLCRTVRFGDTDAAGVLHFPRLLDWCHQAYEESLERFGLPASEIFPSPDHSPAVALPVVHCQADFLAPLVVGDPLAIQLEPRRLNPSRRRCPLPPAINRWLEASAIGQGIQPV
jgi:1,4-dihydroxy-2-naphthoyl-CoA hydrolase